MKARARLPDHAVLLPALLGLSACAWLLTNRLAGDDMRLGILTGSGDIAMDMDAASHSMALGLFMATWVVMMVAMMFPAVAPVVLTFRRWADSRGRSGWATGAFVAGYLTVWTAIGGLVYAVLLSLEAWLAGGEDGAVRAGAILLMGAGVYQFSPLKDVCLKHCRSPLGFLMMHGDTLTRGYSGPFRVGVVHGAYCLGCCWALMIVLVLLGLMNIVWMGVVAAVILVEKVLPAGEVMSRVAGASFVIVGVVLAMSPRVLPPLT
ncbi:MAG: DUF2182 domain-containing protein [Tepidisphaeraceae bacterium]